MHAPTTKTVRGTGAMKKASCNSKVWKGKGTNDKHKQLSNDCPVGGVSPHRVARGQTFVCCVRNPRNINKFCPGTRPGGSVTGVTEKLFMCQMFMCLFWPLTRDPVPVAGPSFLLIPLTEARLVLIV